jgi:hypothetical protein
MNPSRLAEDEEVVSVEDKTDDPNQSNGEVVRQVTASNPTTNNDDEIN